MFPWLNPLFLWPCSIAPFVITKGSFSLSPWSPQPSPQPTFSVSASSQLLQDEAAASDASTSRPRACRTTKAVAKQSRDERMARIRYRMKDGDGMGMGLLPYVSILSQDLHETQKTKSMPARIKRNTTIS